MKCGPSYMKRLSKEQLLNRLKIFREDLENPKVGGGKSHNAAKYRRQCRDMIRETEDELRRRGIEYD